MFYTYSSKAFVALIIYWVLTLQADALKEHFQTHLRNLSQLFRCSSLSLLKAAIDLRMGMEISSAAVGGKKIAVKQQAAAV